ncbi:MAG: DUF2269 domain-containing protein [Nocardioides sp.]
MRKLSLVVHVAASVGWIGAAVTSLVLAALPLVSDDPQLVRGSYLSLRVIGWYALVPFGVASLATGLIQALGTTWGLFRHYWVLLKLLMNVLATVVLLLYMQTLDYLAAQARDAPDVTVAAMGDPSPIVHALGAIAVLLVALVLSVYKPRGLTRRGRRHAAAVATRSLASPRAG